MDCSLDEAVILLDKWRISGASIHCVFLSHPGAGWHVNADAKIFSVSAELLTVEFSERAGLRIPLSKCRFTFSDPREVKNQGFRAVMSAQYESLLKINLSSREELYLGERKNSDYDSNLFLN